MRQLPIALSLATAFSIAPPLSAQDIPERSIDVELRTLVTTETAAERQRGRLEAFLVRDDVRGTAADHSIDLERVRAGLNSLEDREVASLTERLREALDADDLVGGDTFVITSSTVIIVLLVIILIAVV